MSTDDDIAIIAAVAQMRQILDRIEGAAIEHYKQIDGKLDEFRAEFKGYSSMGRVAMGKINAMETNFETIARNTQHMHRLQEIALNTGQMKDGLTQQNLGLTDQNTKLFAALINTQKNILRFTVTVLVLLSITLGLVLIRNTDGEFSMSPSEIKLRGSSPKKSSELHQDGHSIPK